MRAEDILTCARFLQGRFKNPVDLVAAGLVAPGALIVPEAATQEQLERAHLPGYVPVMEEA